VVKNSLESIYLIIFFSILLFAQGALAGKRGKCCFVDDILPEGIHYDIAYSCANPIGQIPGPLLNSRNEDETAFFQRKCGKTCAFRSYS